MTKTCATCKTTKDLSEFHRNSSQPDGYSYRCKPCQKAQAAAYYERHKAEHTEKSKAYYKANKPRILKRTRAYSLQKQYGVSPEEYQRMFATQGGVCAICQRSSKKKLAVDHCHETGKVRKLLCQNCNVGIGLFDDDPDLIFRAMEYLKEHANGRSQLSPRNE